MVHILKSFESDQTNPYENIAIEKLLLNMADEETSILYLWQNANTVVIGRNQNAWAECRVSLLENDGGFLARRLSGGGAVFHDLGNLNFTFLVSEKNFDIQRQMSVIQKACEYAGIRAEFSGRNDLLADGKKFSGNAFYHANGKAYHHGTLLINADMSKLGKYLSPPKSKLQAKGVASVRSRVANLQEFAPELTCEAMKAHLLRAFSDVYGQAVSALTLSKEEYREISKLQDQFSNRDWLFGAALPCSIAFEDKFQWGHIQIQLDANKGIIHQAKVYTDAMDWSVAEVLERVLSGISLQTDIICNVIENCNSLPVDMISDLVRLIKQQEL